MQKLGIAPLTSMFLHGDLHERFFGNQFARKSTYSDGLLMFTGNGEWISRPLNNPLRLRISAYQDNNPRGFACCSATAIFYNYRHPVNAQFRPHPGGTQGSGGTVQLIDAMLSVTTTLPRSGPGKLVEAGQQLELSYRLILFLGSRPTCRLADARCLPG